MNGFEVRNLTAGYGERPALSGVSFALATGQCLALLGPNGSGKSTLMKAILGLTPWRRGEVVCEGTDITNSAPAEVARLISHVPQTEAPNFPFPVADSVRLGRLPHGTAFFDRPEDYQIAHEAMVQAECEDLAHRLITELSGGELQRVLLARALAQQTPVILMDEPTAHMDAHHVESFVRTVNSLRAAGKTLVLAAHDLNLARHCSDQVLLLNKGEAAAQGGTNQILNPDALGRVFGTGFRALENGWLVPEWGLQN